VPCLLENVGDRDKYYIYHVKGKVKKGANRWSTMMYNHVLSLKESTTSMQAAAKEFVYIGDNYCENKNNDDFAFGATLIQNDWYQDVKFLYGPVGHTHNGIDAEHKIHNVDCGNHVAGTLADFVNIMPQVWTQGAPSVLVDDLCLDFSSMFKPCLANVSGFTNTKDNPRSVHAFRFTKNQQTGNVEMHYKVDARLAGKWLGLHAVPDGPGFILLKSRPHHAPSPLESNSEGMKQKYYKELTGKKMTDTISEHGLAYAVPWLAAAGKTNSIPILDVVERERPPGKMGRRVEIGVAGHSAQVMLMDATSLSSRLVLDTRQEGMYDYRTFWAPPVNSARAQAVRNASIQPAADPQGQPQMRYTQARDYAIHGQDAFEKGEQAERDRLANLGRGQGQGQGQGQGRESELNRLLVGALRAVLINLGGLTAGSVVFVIVNATHAPPTRMHITRNALYRLRKPQLIAAIVRAEDAKKAVEGNPLHNWPLLARLV
jgi:hypothetical protein